MIVQQFQNNNCLKHMLDRERLSVTYYYTPRVPETHLIRYRTNIIVRGMIMLICVSLQLSASCRVVSTFRRVHASSLELSLRSSVGTLAAVVIGDAPFQTHLDATRIDAHTQIPNQPPQLLSTNQQNILFSRILR